MNDLQLEVVVETTSQSLIPLAFFSRERYERSLYIKQFQTGRSSLTMLLLRLNDINNVCKQRTIGLLSDATLCLAIMVQSYRHC